MLRKLVLIWGLVIFFLLSSLIQVAAQQPPKQLIIGKLEAGTLTHDSPEMEYAFTARAGLSIEIEMVIADGDLIPRIALKQGDNVLDHWDSIAGAETLKAKYSFAESGQYTIGVSNLEHTSGTFAVTIREIQEAVLVSLNLGTPVYDKVARSETLRYQIQADSQNNRIVQIIMVNSTQSVSIQLITADDKVIGLIGHSLDGGGFRIPLGADDYVLEIVNNDSGSVPVNFEVLLTSASN